jgi:hypothetical protein
MAAAYMIAEEARLQSATNSDNPGAGSYVAAILVPFVGFILAIRALAKDKVGPGLALVLTAWLAMTVWGALFFAVAFHRVESTFSSLGDTSSLVDTTSTDTSDADESAADDSIASGGTGTFSPDDSDGDGFNDNEDTYPFDATKQ